MNSRWNNQPYIDSLRNEEGSEQIKSVNISITGDTGIPSGIASIENGTLNIILNNIKGEQGNSGKNGLPGLNGLSVKLSKDDSYIKTTYTGERTLQASFNKSRAVSPIIIDSYDFTTMKSIILNDIPENVKNVRLKFMSFLAVDDAGKNVGSGNPAYMPGVVSPGSFEYLGTLDPSNGTKYKVSSGKCIINPTFDTKKACEKELEDINKAISSSGKVAVRIESIIYQFSYLDNEDIEVSETAIRERFLTDISNPTNNLIEISELKGEKGEQGEVTAESLLELFKENGYSGSDSTELIKKLISLIQS